MADYPTREYIIRETTYPDATKQELIGELVRCKDCKHNPIETWFDCPLSHLKYDGERWCWKGERKDGDDG